MKKQFLTLLSGMVLAVGVNGQAQQLQMLLTGTCNTLDSQGHIVSQPINNQTLLLQAAQAGGSTNIAGLGLSYHIGGNQLGDTIEVINRTNGAVLNTLYGLYYGEDFGRQALLSASHRQMKRIEYIYTSQNDHSLGSALLTDYYFFDTNGNTNATYVLGQMQWIVTTDATHTNTQVCTASFTTLRPWKF